MLAVLAHEAFDSEEHLFEVKWDGYRAVCFLDPAQGKTRLQSRNLKDLTPRYPSLGTLHKHVDSRALVVLDGEIVALQEGLPDFGHLERNDPGVVYVAFDILWHEDRSVMNTPLIERREVLSRRLRAGGSLVLSEPVMEKGRALYASAGKAGLEGIMAKTLFGPYLPGKRSRHWQKIKHRKSRDCVILGYSKGSVGYVTSLALGLFDPEGLRYVGRVGSGISTREGQDLARRLGALKGVLYDALGSPGDAYGMVWVAPELVCEVEYLEITAGGYLRHPVYKGLRPAKNPSDCILGGSQ
jgi:bifunctional non-homologous end joining protein LigD/DNA ligase-1